MSHDRSELTEDNLYPWKTRQDQLQKFGPKDVPLWIKGRKDHTEIDFVGEHKKIVVAGSETSQPIYQADIIDEVGIMLDPEGEAKLQYTLSPIDDVTGGTASWVDWDPGAVTDVTSEFIAKPLTAFRVVSNSGEVTAEIKTQGLY